MLKLCSAGRALVRSFVGVYRLVTPQAVLVLETLLAICVLTLEGPLVFVSDYPLSHLVTFFVHFELGKLSKLLPTITALEGLLQFQFFPMHLSHVLFQLELVLADVKTFGTRDLTESLIISRSILRSGRQCLDFDLGHTAAGFD